VRNGEQEGSDSNKKKNILNLANAMDFFFSLLIKLPVLASSGAGSGLAATR